MKAFLMGLCESLQAGSKRAGSRDNALPMVLYGCVQSPRTAQL